MAAITFGTMKTRVALACGNMPSSDPWYTYLGDHVNEAANAIVLLSVQADRRNINLFPELRNRRWTDITVNNQGYLLKPTDALIIDSVTSTHLTTAYNASTDKEYPVVEEPDQFRFGLFDKTSQNWPQIWCEASTSILLWPTPVTAYLTYVVLRGIRKETALTAASDTFQMNEVFHPVVIDYATYLMMRRMGWHDEAEKFLSACQDRLTNTANVLGLQNKRNRTRIRIAGGL